MTGSGKLRGGVLALSGLLFLMSGFAALLYQVSWQRVLGIFSGVHTYSITIIVTAFMAGLGFGSFFGGKIADRRGAKTAVMLFGLCELLIGLFALISPWLYSDVAYGQLGFLVRYPAVLPSVHLILLFPPTFLMGASLPLLARGLVRDTEGAARTIGVLYGVNTLGAALGALSATWLIVGAVGFEGAIRIGAALNFAAAAGAVVIWASMSERSAATESSVGSTAGERVDGGLGLRTWAAIYGLSGFVALSLELLWFRVLDVTIKSSPYTFGHLLGLFLLFLGIGSLVGSFTVARVRRPDRWFFWGQWGITLSAAAALLLLTYLPLESLTRFWTSDAGIVFSEMTAAWQVRDTAEGARLLALARQIYIGLPLLLLAVPTLLMGLTFNTIQRAVQTDLESVGRRVGTIQTANIVGSIFGSLLTGTLFLRWLGTPATFRLLFLAGGIFGAIAVVRSFRGAARVGGLIGVAATIALCAVALPSNTPFWARFHGSPPSGVIVAEDASSIVALQRLGPERAVLRVNGTGHSVLPYGGPHTLLGMFPMLVHPHPTEALVIGLGAGNTAWAGAASPTIERLDVYEIARPEYVVIRQVDDVWFDYPPIDQVLDDPRVNVNFSDGRLALRIEGRKYDVIEADALEAYMAYSGNLYSLEFFESAREALKPGGMFVTYTPTERTRETMVAAFPYVVHLWSPRFLSFMVGSNEPVEIDGSRLLARLTEPGFQAWLQEAGLGGEVASDFTAFVQTMQVLYIDPSNRDQFLSDEVNTDLFPRDEFDKSVPVEG